MTKKTIPILGMACSACSVHVEKRLNELNGIAEVHVSLPGRSAVISYDPSLISLSEMKKAVQMIGYEMVIDNETSVEEIETRAYKTLQQKVILSWMLAILCMALTMKWVKIILTHLGNILAMLLALVNFAFCGRKFYITAWKQLQHRTASMDTLVALSTGVAFCFSVFNIFWGASVWSVKGIEWHTYFDTSIMIISFVLTGKLIEERARKGMSGSIRKLMGLAPKTAHLVDGDNITDVPIATIVKGDKIEVRAGEKVPVDGSVIHASSFMTADGAYVDESMITGEPIPVMKQMGGKVLAGTIISQGKIQLKATEIGENTALAHIIRMVEQAQASKAPVQRLVDKMALVFVPIVIIISLLTFLLWWIIGGQEAVPQAIVYAMAVLVIACPCALGLATPTALMVGIGKAADNNVLIKDATALESLKNVDSIVIDKTGTLTIPNQQVNFTQADGLDLEQREVLKPHAKEAMGELQRQGIDIYMMSGDREDAARYWAEKAGISHYSSQAVAQDKENLVKQLQSQGKRVAMIGDGINDTQALALADVSVAMGRGTDVAMDIAQVTLLGDNLLVIPKAIQISKITVKLIRQNLFWAFIYNLVCIPLAAGALHTIGLSLHISPMWASGLMALSSISVVLNSLRIKYMV